MHDSQTWQTLPPRLLIPLLQGVISQVEAAEIWDLVLRSPPWQQTVTLPPRLHSAAQRLKLWAMPVQAPLQ